MSELRGLAAAAVPFGVFLEAAPDAMVVVDGDGRVVAANQHAFSLFGYTAETLLGQPIEVLVPNRFRGSHGRNRTAFVGDPHRRPMGSGLDLHGRRRDGSEFPVEISLSPLALPEGLVVISAVRDVSDRKRLESSIRRQNAELELQNRQVQEASRLKSEFLANMSHELRTPLNSVIGFTQLLHDGHLGPPGEGHREYLADILSSAKHLLHLINDVLDLAKVESGTMQFFPESVDLRAASRRARWCGRSPRANRFASQPR